MSTARQQVSESLAALVSVRLCKAHGNAEMCLNVRGDPVAMPLWQ